MTQLVSLAAAKAQLRVLHDDDDEDIDRKLSEATGIVIDYLKRPDHGWTEETVPYPVSASIKLVLTGLWDDREGDPLTPAVKNLLRRLRDPALA